MTNLKSLLRHFSSVSQTRRKSGGNRSWCSPRPVVTEACEPRVLLAADFTASLQNVYAGHADNSVEINLSNSPAAGGTLEGWVDFDGDGLFLSQGEQVFANKPIPKGTSSHFLEVPARVLGGDYAAKFIVSTSDPDSHTVEQQITIQQWGGQPKPGAAQIIDSTATFSLVTGDVDADGDIDVVSVDLSGKDFVWFENDGQGNFTERAITDNGISSHVSDLKLVDLDGDGRRDIVAQRSFPFPSNPLTVFYQTITGGFEKNEIESIQDSTKYTEIADFNADGHLDLLIADSHIKLLLSNGDRTFTESIVDDRSLLQILSLTSGDIDGDGDIDAIHSTFGKARLYRNDGAGVFEIVDDYLTVPFGSAISTSKIVDFNNDGRMDVVSSGFVGSTARWFEQTVSGFVDHVTDIPSHMFDYEIADFDNDGDYDYLAAFHPGIGQRTGAELFLNSGDNLTFTPRPFEDSATTETHVAAADIDGDGDLDVVSDHGVGLAWYSNNPGEAGPTKGTIRGRVWNDINGNGQQEANEPYLQSVQIYIDANNDGQLNGSEEVRTTDADGRYFFADQQPGEHTIRQVLGQPRDQTYPRQYVGMAYRDSKTELFSMTPDGRVFRVGNQTTKRIHALIQTNSGRLIGSNFETDEILEVDPATGAETVLHAFDGELAAGLAYDSATDTIYTVGRHSAVGSPRQLMTINPSTGVPTGFGPGIAGTGHISDITFDWAANRVVAFDNNLDEFYAFDLNGTVQKLSNAAQPINSWSLAFNGEQFIMELAGVADNRQLIAVDPDTGTWQNAFNASAAIPAESLDFVQRGNTAHIVNVAAGGTVNDVNFGRIEALHYEIVVSPNRQLEVFETATNEESFAVTLSAQPSSNVVINVSVSDITEAFSSSRSLTFTPGNWNVGQIVSISGVNDADHDGDVASTVNLIVENEVSDNNYNNQSAVVDVLTIDDEEPLITTITGRVFDDKDGNGERNTNEPGLPGVLLYLDTNGNAKFDNGESSATSGQSGEYEFIELATGDYIVRQVVAAPRVQTSPQAWIGTAYNHGETQLFEMSADGQVSRIGQPTTDRIYGLIMTTSGEIFGTNFETDQLYRINPATGQETAIGQPNPHIVGGLTYDPATDTIYTVGRLQAGEPVRLLVINRLTGAMIPIGPGIEGLTGTSALTFDSKKQRIVAFDNDDDEFYAFDLEGYAEKLSDAAQPIHSWSLGVRGEQFVMQLAGPENNRQLIQVNPDTGTWEHAFQADEPITSESLEFVSRGNIAHRITIAAGRQISNIDFGQIEPAAGFVVHQTQEGTRIVEGGDNDTVSVRLSRQPISDVVIDVRLPENSQISSDTQQLRFTSANWNTSQIITLSAIDDAIAESSDSEGIVFDINAGLSDDAFDGLSAQTVNVEVMDNDLPGFSVSSEAVEVEEGGVTATFTVLLTAAPNSNVIIRLNSTGTEADFASKSLTFDSDNWDVPQPVTVTANDDVVKDGTTTSIITLAVDRESSDSLFNNITEKTVTVTIHDNDVAGIQLSEQQLTVSESGTEANFGVELTAKPVSDVVLAIGDFNDGLISVSPTTLTFTSDNWNTPQSVILKGEDNNQLGGNNQTTVVVEVSDSQSDEAFREVSNRNVAVIVSDNDVANIVIDHSSLVVSEDQTAADLHVSLSARPNGNVTISATASDASEATLDKNSLVFTADNWNVPQTLRVTGVNDDINDGDQDSTVTLTINVAVSDASFGNAANQTVVVTTTDNNFAGFTLNKTAATVSESGTQDTFTVVLDTAPNSNVVLSSVRASVGGVSVSPTFLTFTPQNWNIPQSVTLTGVDDFVMDGPQTTIVNVSIVAAESDDAFDSLVVQTVDVTTEDNDTEDNVPAILAPIGTVNDQTPALSWSAITGATAYDVWLQPIGENLGPTVNTTVTGTTYQIASPLKVGRYRLWVRATTALGTKTRWATEVFRIDASPTLHDLPFHGADSRPTISWNSVAGAKGYMVYISNLTTGDTGFVNQFVTDTSFTPEQDLGFGRFRIWVRAIAQDNFAAAWSTASDYFLGPQLLGPIGTTVESQPTFSWTGVAGIDSYQIYVIRNGQVIVNETGITDTSYTLHIPEAGGDFRWWVRGYTSDNSPGPWSNLAEFSSGGRTALSVAEGITSSIPTLEWPAVSGAESYEIYVSHVDGDGFAWRHAGIEENSYPSQVLLPGKNKVWIRTTLQDDRKVWGRGSEIVVEQSPVTITATPIAPVNPTLADDVEFAWNQDTPNTTTDIYLHNGKTAILREGISGNQWTPDVPLELGPWTWWVRSRNEQGQTGPWSVAAKTDTGGRPEFSTPPTPTSPTLAWTRVDAATRYILQIDNLTTSDRSVVREDNLASDSINIVDLTSGTYRAWVQAINGDTSRRSPWSQQFDFTVTSSQPDEDQPLDVRHDTQLAVLDSRTLDSRLAVPHSRADDLSSMQIPPVNQNTAIEEQHAESSPHAEVALADRVMEQLLTSGQWLESGIGE